MKTQIHVLLWTMALIASAPAALAQPAPMKWGDIPSEDLEMTTYAADSNASAVILGEYGEVKVNKFGDMQYDYHLRVKLLTEASYDEWGSYALTYWDGDYAQRIRKLEAQTFVLVNGKEERHKLGKKSIYKETVAKDLKQLKFTFPALQPGAIVEFRYSMTTEDPIHLPDWTFQHSEPTVWSEYRATIARELGYVRVSKNTAFVIEDSTPVRHLDGSAVQYRWVMMDVSALREEPYITTLEDYRATIKFQLASFFTPSTGVVEYFTTWDKLAEELLDHQSFGKALKGSRRTRQQTESLLQGVTDPYEKLRKIEQFVRNSISWNGEYGYMADKNLDDVLNSTDGSSADQTLLLIAMLREAGIEAYPVLLSTRSNGAVLRAYPIYSQFDYVIAYAKVQGQEFLIDVTEPLAPIDLLPLRALNGQGWLIMDHSNQWISVSTEKKYARVITLEGEIDESGAFSGRLQAAGKGYGALAWRKSLEETDKSDVMKSEVLDGLNDIEFFEMQVKNQNDCEEALLIESGVHIQNFAQSAGDFMYVGSHAFGRVEENPLKLKKRSFPVDLGYPIDYLFTYRIKLPAGYALQEQPGNLVLRLPEKGGSFMRTTSVIDDVILIQSRFMLDHSEYEPRLYSGLKEMYDRVVAAQAEQIVLKRVES